MIDDECDYFSTDSNQWLSKEDRDALRKREEELRAARHGSRRDRKVRPHVLSKFEMVYEV